MQRCRRTGPWRVILAAIVCAGLLAPAQVAHAKPRPDIDALNKRADKLSKEYRGGLVELQGARKDVGKAKRHADTLDGRLRAVRARVARMAATQYKTHGSGSPTMTMFTQGGDPQAALDRAGLVEHLSRNNWARIGQVKKLIADSGAAHRKLTGKVRKIKSRIHALEKNRTKVRKQISKYKAQLPTAPGNITPRMAKVYRAVVAKFGKGKTVGCYRSNGGIPGGGEHPKGRACDFMVASGTMPSADMVDHGHRIAQWAISHASKYGIMYIIYRQRIYDMRGGSGWRQMEDRGSITANHYDHVHISVF